MDVHSDKELLKIVNDNIDCLDLDKKPEKLYKPIRYVLSMGGKRLRPVMCLMSCEMFGGDIMSAMKPALALEVFHNFTLLHDDIMDKAVRRRNMDCVHVKWNDNVAILSGDAMSIFAYQTLNNLPENKMKPCFDLFSKTAIEVCEGQQYDMDFEEMTDVTEAEYLEMIRLKTAVLVAASMKMGAIIAGASDKDCNLIYDFGINVGMAFQLQDDYLDVFGNVETFGKNIGGDIVTNKKTFMLIKAKENACEADKKELDKWICCKQFNSCDKIKAVTSVFRNSGVEETCKSKMEEYLSNAVNCINEVSIESSRKIPLMNLAKELMNRNF
jgi:geranylgeranyl diphosphate synthase type II